VLDGRAPEWSRHQSISAKHHHEDSDSKQKANNKQKPNKKIHLTQNSAGFSQNGHKQIKH
jgi:hypothetical protein